MGGGRKAQHGISEVCARKIALWSLGLSSGEGDESRLPPKRHPATSMTLLDIMVAVDITRKLRIGLLKTYRIKEMMGGRRKKTTSLGEEAIQENLWEGNKNQHF